MLETRVDGSFTCLLFFTPLSFQCADNTFKASLVDRLSSLRFKGVMSFVIVDCGKIIFCTLC